MSKNRVKLKICGTDYIITSEDSESYVRLVSDEVDKKMSEILKENSRVSVSMAAVLVALDYCDIAKKAENSLDNLRIQIKNYLEETTKARAEADSERNRSSRLKSELEQVKKRLSECEDEFAKMKEKLNICFTDDKILRNSNRNSEISDITEDILSFFDEKLEDNK